MGRREIGMEPLRLSTFADGFFPNKDFNDVPDAGSSDCRHVFYKKSALRPFPGMDLINPGQAANVSGQGLHYMNVDNATRRVAVFGNMFFEDSGGVWVDRTGAAVIGVGDRVQFIDHQEGANQYLIGFPGGGNPPFRWTGSGNATILGGSPPNLQGGAKYHDTIFGFLDEAVYFSDTGLPEIWNPSRWQIPFEKNISTILEHGASLAVLMGGHIGSVRGYDEFDFTAEEKEIRTFGCVGKLAATNCHWGENDLKVIATMAKDGLWVFDEAYGPHKVFGEDWIEEFNQANLSKASIAYWGDEHLLFVALPYAASTEPNYLVIVNTKTGAFWPGPDIHASSIRSLASMRDDDGNEAIYFVDSNGYAFKFNMATTSYHTGTETEKIDWRWKSKRFDLEDVHSFGEAVMLADSVGDWGLNLAVHFGLGLGDGNTGTISLSNTEDLIGTTFILGASTLGGSNYVFKPLVGVGGFGRYLQLTLTPEGDEANDVLGSTFVLGSSQLGSSNSFRLRRLEVHLHRHRRGGNDQ